MAADSMGRDWEVEIYRQFLFGDDDRTYSKCEDGDVEDGDGAGEGGDSNGGEVSEGGDGEDGAKTGEADTSPNIHVQAEQQQQQPN